MDDQEDLEAYRAYMYKIVIPIFLVISSPECHGDFDFVADDERHLDQFNRWFVAALQQLFAHRQRHVSGTVLFFDVGNAEDGWTDHRHVASAADFHPPLHRHCPALHGQAQAPNCCVCALRHCLDVAADCPVQFGKFHTWPRLPGRMHQRRLLPLQSFPSQRFQFTRFDIHFHLVVLHQTLVAFAGTSGTLGFKIGPKTCFT
uniref:G-protein coupled receptors family 1 profile domain-containing protein n=1 Tax=Panagrolaimus sp. JU765 TaxID=591449 RepID=A0AC34QI59_9BILA